jgi:hypothetical protein
VIEGDQGVCVAHRSGGNFTDACMHSLAATLHHGPSHFTFAFPPPDYQLSCFLPHLTLDRAHLYPMVLDSCSIPSPPLSHCSRIEQLPRSGINQTHLCSHSLTPCFLEFSILTHQLPFPQHLATLVPKLCSPQEQFLTTVELLLPRNIGSPPVPQRSSVIVNFNVTGLCKLVPSVIMGLHVWQ